MTIQGAMNELINLLNADDIPIYYKGCIKKVIETIDDYIDGKDDYVKRKTEPQKKYPTEWCENCGLWQDNNCMGVAECKRIIEMLTDVGIMKDEPQTERSSE